jgi:DNA polymerase III subunit gamma/tau
MSYKVIARKYRPQTFSQIVGQQHVTRTLANAIQHNRVAHAYIFSGVRGVGKTTAARILAKALNCAQGPTAEPDNTCDSCEAIKNGNSLDVLEIDAASNRGIDQIRELREMVRYAPAASRYKVVILDEAHQLTDEASNALLKTLEEPPERVIFILATTQPEDLADTIKSRAQLFQFRSLTFQEIAGQIEHIAKQENLKIDSGAIAVLARAAEGSLRDGLSLLEQAIAYGGDTITDAQVRELLGVVAESVLDDLVEAITAQSSEKALALVHRLISDGQNLQHFCREAIRHFRNLLVARVCGPDSQLIAAPEDERPRLANQSAQFSEEDLTRFFNILVATEDDVRRKPDPRLHLELGLLKLINAQRLVPLEEAIAELRGEGSPSARAATPSRQASGASAAPSTPSTPNVAASPPLRAAPAPAAAAYSASASGAAVRMVPESEAPSLRADMTSPRLNADTTAESAPWARTGANDPAASPSRAGTTESPARNSVVPQSAPAVPAAANTGRPVPASPPRVVARAVEESAGGLGAAQVEAIQSALQGQKFLWSMVEHASRWELDASELRLFFPTESRALAEMLQARDPMERLRTVLNQVLGQPLRVCVKIESGRVGTARGAELRARFEEDPIVRAMLQKFGGRISDVKRHGEE